MNLDRQDEGGYDAHVSLGRLSSLGPLTNSTRVGILIVLVAVRKATFTDLLLAVKLPKSSLNTSLSILQEAGYITSHTGFSRKDGPRTVVQITELGEKAVREYAQLMHELTGGMLSE